MAGGGGGSAADMEEQMLQSSQNFLRVLDKFNDFNVTGFVTSDNLKFLLLHKQRSEDSIRRFFHDVCIHFNRSHPKIRGSKIRFMCQMSTKNGETF